MAKARGQENMWARTDVGWMLSPELQPLSIRRVPHLRGRARTHLPALSPLGGQSSAEPVGSPAGIVLRRFTFIYMYKHLVMQSEGTCVGSNTTGSSRNRKDEHRSLS